MRLFTRVGQALVVAGALSGGPAKPAMANSGGSSSPINPIRYTSSEFKKAFDCYTATIRGNVTRQDEANFALTSLPYFDNDRDGQLTPKEIDGIRNPRVRGMIVNLAENLETCGSVKTSEKPVLNPSAEPVQIKRPEDTMAAERDSNRRLVRNILLAAAAILLLSFLKRKIWPVSLWRSLAARLYPKGYQKLLKGPRHTAERINAIADRMEVKANKRIEAAKKKAAKRAERKATREREQAERKAAEEKKKAKEEAAKAKKNGVEGTAQEAVAVEKAATEDPTLVQRPAEPEEKKE